MEESKNQVVAMYDVRGIQKYIFKTAKVKDAMGASGIVEDIIMDALKAAVKKKQLKKTSVNLEWDSDEKPLPFKEDPSLSVQVLFIGGGNAFVVFENHDLCVDINKCMSHYILEHTYSLQLAVAIVDKTDKYSDDYNNLHREMNRIKADMSNSKPLGALPIMQIELKTGYPCNNDNGNSYETVKKREYKKYKGIQEDSEEKILDNLINQKGIDSNLAVIHIDGNNMGMRIRDLIKDESNYNEAIRKMRQISHNIAHSYKNVFDGMHDQFTKTTKIKGKKIEKFIRKILVAGDDITYVCNAQIAFATVKYFCEEISKQVMYNDKNRTKEDNLKVNGFSVCAGIAYMGGHFPFDIAYDTAEACCDSAKDVAKNINHKDKERIGNFVDFQICKNIQCRNLEELRENEYKTASGEMLLKRPYFVETESDFGLRNEANQKILFSEFEKELKYFKDEKNIPRSFAKKLRNTYPLGKNQINTLKRFLDSRNWKMPDEEMYEDEDNRAKWYDALEMLDYYYIEQDEESQDGGKDE